MAGREALLRGELERNGARFEELLVALQALARRRARRCSPFPAVRSARRAAPC